MNKIICGDCNTVLVEFSEYTPLFDSISCGECGSEKLKYEIDYLPPCPECGETPYVMGDGAHDGFNVVCPKGCAKEYHEFHYEIGALQHWYEYAKAGG